jgi:hypothetical protein
VVGIRDTGGENSGEVELIVVERPTASAVLEAALSEWPKSNNGARLMVMPGGKSRSDEARDVLQTIGGAC